MCGWHDTNVNTRSEASTCTQARLILYVCRQIHRIEEYLPRLYWVVHDTVTRAGVSKFIQVLLHERQSSRKPHALEYGGFSMQGRCSSIRARALHATSRSQVKHDTLPVEYPCKARNQPAQENILPLAPAKGNVTQPLLHHGLQPRQKHVQPGG